MNSTEPQAIGVMRKLLVAAIISISFLAAPAIAHEETDPYDLPGNFEDSMNERKGEQLPGALKLLFGNERLNFFVDKKFAASIVTEDGVFQGLSTEHFEESTSNLYASEETIGRISESDDPSKTFLESYRNGAIRRETFGIWNKAKYGIGSFFLRKL